MERKLAAILAADVVGYSRLMEQDEAGTFERLRAHRKELFEPEIEKHSGHLFKLMGDGLLAEFASVVDALQCAVLLQRGMAERNKGLTDDRRIDIRIGINLGDVIVESSDRHGEGVNIAARLQDLAEPGGICISRQVFDHVETKLGLAYDDLGEQRVKNIAKPIHAYRVRGEAMRTLPRQTARAGKPLLAVLPFEVIGDEPDLERIAAGLIEEITTGMTRFRMVSVLSRHLAIGYKDRTVEIHHLRHDIGADYVLTGSLRQSAERMRATVQLTEIESGRELWAEQYDRGLVDTFAVQDELTQAIIAQIEHVLVAAEHRHAIASGLAEQQILNQKAGWHLFRFTRGDNARAIDLLRRAIAQNPDADRRYQALALALGLDLVFGWASSSEDTIAEMVGAAERSVSLREGDAWNLATLSWSLLFARQFERAIASATRMIELNPNSGVSYGVSALVLAHCGDAEAALDLLAKARRMAPQAPFMFNYLTGGAVALHRLGRFREAAEMAESAGLRRPNYFQPQLILAAALVNVDETERALAAMAAALRIAPSMTVAWLRPLIPLREETEFARLVSDLRSAGWDA
jgi:adenylate cyclase